MRKINLSILAISILATSSLLAESLDKKIEKIEADNEEIWEVVEKIETKTFTDKLNLSFELRSRVDSFSYDNNGIGSNIGKAYDTTASKNKRREMAFPQKKEWDPQYSVRGFINMNATGAGDSKFTGRIRFDHSSQGDQRLCILSPQDEGKDLPASSSDKFTAFDIDRAFVDVPFLQKTAVPLTVTGGILPTTSGMSSNIIENTPRRSVFPTLMFDSNVYGGILTANLSKIAGVNMYARAIVGKGYTLNDDMYYYQCNRENIQNDDVAGLFVEAKLPLPQNIDNTIWVGYNNNANIKATPFLGGDGAQNDKSNTKLKTQKSLGDIANIGGGIELRSISLGESQGFLDIFAHYSASIPDGNGNCVNYTGTDINCANGKVEANPKPYYDSEMARGTLLADNGSSFYLGFKYTAPWNNKGTKIGYEFNHGSDSWWSATQGSEDVFNKLSIRGNVHEAYVIQDITKNIYLRAGYMSIDEEYTGSGWHFGTPMEKDATQNNIYLLMNAYF